MKKILSFFILMLLPMLARAEPVVIDGIYYNLITKGNAAEVTINPDKYTGSMVIPASVTYEGVEYSVTSIGSIAFRYCSGLTSVTIPNSVTIIGGDAFYDCSSLTSVTIPNSVTSIGSETFSGCSGLTSVTIPNSVTSIGGSAFYGCSGLTSVTIPNSVTIIDESTFEGCSGVTTLNLPNGLQIIRQSAFKGCSSLSSLTLPATVEFIYQEAFAGCTGLESVKALPETPPFLYDNSFSNYDIPLYASETAIGAYQTKEPWSKFAQFLTLDGTEVEVPQCATPTVAYQDGQLMLDCETEGAECVWTLRNPDTLSGRGKTIELARQYELTVYATAEGMTDSDQVTYLIVWGDNDAEGDNVIRIGAGGEVCDVNKDGIVDVADIATIIDRMAGK